MTTLVVDHLPFDTSASDLRVLFGRFGIVEKVHMISPKSKKDDLSAKVILSRGDINQALKMLGRDPYNGKNLSIQKKGGKRRRRNRRRSR